MLVKSVDEALALIKGETAFPADGQIELGSGFVLQVKIPNPPVNSSITPAFMEAFLELQRQIYQLAALQKRGVANATFLSEEDKRELDISVIVKEGSSLLELNTGEAFASFLTNLAGKMSGTEITISIIAAVVLLSSAWGFKSYLAYRKSVKQDELRSEEYRQALETIQAANAEERQKYEALIEVMKQNGEIGKKALEVAERSFDSFVKANAKMGEASVNGTVLSQMQAQALRSSVRVKAEREEASMLLRARIIDINTKDPVSVSVSIRDAATEDEYALSFPKGIAAKDEPYFIKSLVNRTELMVELKAELHDGVVRSVSFVRLLEYDK